MATATECEKVEARLLAAKILTTAAQRSSAAMDTFSSWLLVGFGAAFALILANMDSVTKFIPFAHLKSGAILYLASALLAVADKFLASFVAAGTGSASDGDALARDLESRGARVDLPELLREVQKGLMWPWSLIARYMADSTLAGDHAVAGRVHTKASQFQGYVVLVQALLCIVSAAVVVYGTAI